MTLRKFYLIYNEYLDFNGLKKKDEEGFIHPSWDKREYYIEHFDFDEKLIRQIAADVGCSNSKLIQKVCNYYKRIVLK